MGYFAFFTPPGQYYLQASEAGGFQSWRSPLIEVITQVVHRNIPLTQFGHGNAAHVMLTPSGLSQVKVNVSPGSMVEWRSASDAAGTTSQLASLNANPVGRLLTPLGPLINPLGFDSGTLIPGSIYQRQFITPGLFLYASKPSGSYWVSACFSSLPKTLKVFTNGESTFRSKFKWSMNRCIQPCDYDPPASPSKAPGQRASKLLPLLRHVLGK